MDLIFWQLRQSCLSNPFSLYLENNNFLSLQHVFCHNRDGMKERDSVNYKILFVAEKVVNMF